MLGDFSNFDQASLLDISSYINWPSHFLQFVEQQFAEQCLGRQLVEDFV